MTGTDRKKYFSIDTPFGPCTVAFRKMPFRICSVFLPGQAVALPGGRKGNGFYGNPEGPAEAREAARKIEGYFKGEPLKVPVKWLDLGALTPLQRKVLMATAEIPYGHTVSYGTLAKKIDRPRAYRFVGSTMAINPVPLIIPCHRVIKSDGRIGRFGGGVELKRELIALEKEHSRKGEKPN